MNSVQDPFSRLIGALEPWLDQVVIIGGWAHQLYRQHPSAQEMDYPPLRTLDTDVAVPLKLPNRNEDIHARLLARDFKADILGDHRPPITRYVLRDEPSGFFVEFLTPLIGAEYDRKGRRKATMEVAGIASQRLRHLEILLHRPWSIDFSSNELEARVQIANPVSYIAQKVLIHGRRKREDRAKDILYMHDTLEIFGARLHELHDLWLQVVSPQLHRRQLTAVSTSAKALFGTLSDDIRRAAQISKERALSPERIRESCQYGFNQVFE